MAEKSVKRLKLEQSLADDPRDAFLRYSLAVQCLRDGDAREGRERLSALIADEPGHVAALQQLGQSYMDEGEVEEAASAFRAGIAQAQAVGDRHAASEMQGMLDSLG